MADKLQEKHEEFINGIKTLASTEHPTDEYNKANRSYTLITKDAFLREQLNEFLDAFDQAFLAVATVAKTKDVANEVTYPSLFLLGVHLCR